MEAQSRAPGSAFGLRRWFRVFLPSKTMLPRFAGYVRSKLTTRLDEPFNTGKDAESRRVNNLPMGRPNTTNYTAWDAHTHRTTKKEASTHQWKEIPSGPGALNSLKRELQDGFAVLVITKPRALGPSIHWVGALT